jgi:MFS superfamily sulfate permease-like transporter
MLEELIGTLREQSITFAVAEPNGRLRNSLQRAGLEKTIGADKVFPSVDAALKGYLTQYPNAAAQRGLSAKPA